MKPPTIEAWACKRRTQMEKKNTSNCWKSYDHSTFPYRIQYMAFKFQLSWSYNIASLHQKSVNSQGAPEGDQVKTDTKKTKDQHKQRWLQPVLLPRVLQVLGDVWVKNAQMFSYLMRDIESSNLHLPQLLNTCKTNTHPKHLWKEHDLFIPLLNPSFLSW